MYLEHYPREHRASCAFPAMTRLSHSFDNPNWSYQYHSHQQETELVYIGKGEGSYYINTGSYRLKRGVILIVEHGAIHSLTSDAEHPLSCWTCAIEAGAESGFLLPTDVCPCMEAGHQEGLIRSLFLELDRCRKDMSEATRTHCDTIAAALSSIYVNRFRSHPKVERPMETSFARDILVYMNEHYTSRITLEGLAKTFFISANSISHTFAKAYGISPINYVIDRRMNDAKWLLINTDDTLSSISRRIGYDNTNHFCNLFEKRMGLPPRVFRERYRNR